MILSLVNICVGIGSLHEPSLALYNVTNPSMDKAGRELKAILTTVDHNENRRIVKIAIDQRESRLQLWNDGVKRTVSAMVVKLELTVINISLDGHDCKIRTVAQYPLEILDHCCAVSAKFGPSRLTAFKGTCPVYVGQDARFECYHGESSNLSHYQPNPETDHIYIALCRSLLLSSPDILIVNLRLVCYTCDYEDISLYQDPDPEYLTGRPDHGM